MTPPSRPRRLRARLATASLSAIAAGMSGCLVGPNYGGPPDAAPIASAPGAGFARARTGPYTAVDPPARWWEALDDRELTRLINLAFADSPNLAQAQARVRSARQTLREQRTGLLPKGGADAAYAHLHLPSGDIGSLSGASGAGGASVGAASASSASSSSVSDVDLYSASFDALWEIDLFGGVRRAIENAKATLQAQQATFQDSQVQLASEVAQNYINLRDAQARIRLGRQNADVQGRELALTRQRRAGGTASDADVERLVNQLSQTNAQNLPLRAQRDQDLDQLALLTGREPGVLDAELGDDRPVPRPPAVVATGDPSAMLRRRPDIREAERELAARTATIGQDIANYFPSLTLVGTIGQTSTQASTLFSSKSFTAIGAPSLSWNLLGIPKTQAQVRGAEADRDAALENYRQTVLAALQDAEDSLSRFGAERDTLAQLTLSRDSADRAVALIRTRYAGGTASLIDLLDTERQQMSAEQNLSQGQAQLTTAYVALQKSLGLGWGARPPESSADAARSGGAGG